MLNKRIIELREQLKISRRQLAALAYPEIVHTLFVLIWVVFLSWEIEYKNFLKKIGF